MSFRELKISDIFFENIRANPFTFQPEFPIWDPGLANHMPPTRAACNQRPGLGGMNSRCGIKASGKLIAQRIRNATFVE